MKEKSFPFSALICLYKPNLELVKRNLEVLKKLNIYTVLVDDSSNDSSVENLENFLQNENNFILLKKTENLGIGNSLNVGCEFLKKLGHKWVLTLDQDSILEEDWLQLLASKYDHFLKEQKDTFIFHSIPQDPITKEIFYYKVSSTPFEGIGISYCAFTSGSVMSLELWEKLGKFDEELFLDYVDFDMCFRARLSGYKIYAVEKASMKHTVGNRELYKFLNRTIVLINHSPQRNYYVVRNAYIMRKKYGKQFPEFKKGDKIFMWKRSIKAIFFEKNRIQKFFYILIGILHGFLNKKGKLKLV